MSKIRQRASFAIRCFTAGVDRVGRLSQHPRIVGAAIVVAALTGPGGFVGVVFGWAEAFIPAAIIFVIVLVGVFFEGAYLQFGTALHALVVRPGRYPNLKGQSALITYTLNIEYVGAEKVINCTGKLVALYWEGAEQPAWNNVRGQDTYLQWDGTDAREVSFKKAAVLKVVHRRDGDGYSTIAAFDPTKREQLVGQLPHLLDIEISADNMKTQSRRYRLPSLHSGDFETLEEIGEIDAVRERLHRERDRKIQRLSAESEKGRVIRDGIRRSEKVWVPAFEGAVRDWESGVHAVLKQEVPAQAERFLVDLVAGGQQFQPGAHPEVANWGNFMDRRLAALAEIIRELSQGTD